MKKILLGLFLILGVVSFALPNYVSEEKIRNSGYEITDEEEFGFRIARQKNNGDATVILYYLDYPEVSSAKQLSEMSVKTAPEEFKFLGSTENKKAYINKFVSPEGKGVYSFVGKKSKIKNCYIVIMHSTSKQLSNSELTRTVDVLLDEAESFLK
ncbi:hypothetical protein [Fusobacterium hwasookii]|jgi:hypothetical protein|uniref:Uncharacterized protein n=1 Tax=Fusobacterium hwasookii ChDC F128 TaxID=1216362 RepID=A0ABN0GYM4_9FUSO|nr:hypothetical protein [Fusobacterium hwasookii]EJU07083.1 hypothetical protein B437_08768 [Fusobacterium hwasookii ChDC F128]QNE66531.1 hypothetical protein H5V36_00975 [Fusobacterium hwasookii]